jgi:hypothetical protein
MSIFGKKQYKIKDNKCIIDNTCSYDEIKKIYNKYSKYFYEFIILPLSETKLKNNYCNITDNYSNNIYQDMCKLFSLHHVNFNENIQFLFTHPNGISIIIFNNSIHLRIMSKEYNDKEKMIIKLLKNKFSELPIHIQYNYRHVGYYTIQCETDEYYIGTKDFQCIFIFKKFDSEIQQKICKIYKKYTDTPYNGNYISFVYKMEIKIKLQLFDNYDPDPYTRYLSVNLNPLDSNHGIRELPPVFAYKKRYMKEKKILYEKI